MKKILVLFTIFTSFFFLAGTNAKACELNNSVPVTSLSAGFDAWKVVTSAMEECGILHLHLIKNTEISLLHH